MANSNIDVLRVFDTPANLSANLRNLMLGFDTTNKRLAAKDGSGTMYYFESTSGTGFLKADGTVTPTDNFNWGANNLTNVAQLGATNGSFDDLEADNLTMNLTQDYRITENGSSLAIQGKSAGSAGNLELFSEDGDGTDGNSFRVYAEGTPGAVTDSSHIRVGFDVGTPAYFVNAVAEGTGTSYPLRIQTQGNARQIVLNTTTDKSVDFAGRVDLEGGASILDHSTVAADKDFRFGGASTNTDLKISGSEFEMEHDPGTANVSRIKMNTDGIKLDTDSTGNIELDAADDVDISCGGIVGARTKINKEADGPITCFEEAAEGKTEALKISGFFAADGLRTMQLSVGSTAANQADIEGNYDTLQVSTNLKTTGNLITGNLTAASTTITAASAMLFQTDNVFQGDDRTNGSFSVASGSTLNIESGGFLDIDNSGGIFTPRRVRQSAEPTPANGELLVWSDSDDDKVYLVFNDGNAGVVKIELT